MEIWKDVPGYVGLYQISNYGRVKSVFRNEICGNMNRKRNEKILKPSLRKRYYFVSLSKNGIKYNAVIHRLVAAAFIPNPENKPCIDHIDGDRANNHADNLRWVTVKENQNNPITKSKWIGRKAKPHHEKAIEQIKNGIVVNVFVSIQEAARKGNFSATAICKVCKGKGNLHKGYKWRYKK